MNSGPAGPSERDAARGTSAALRVVVADDQTAVREGLATLLDLLADITVVGQAADGEEAVALVERLAPDVVLMDLRMPRCDGVEATERIRRSHPGTQVVVLTTYAEDGSILAALRAGALGFLTKDAGRAEIRRALQAAASGQALLDPEAHRRMLEAAVGGSPKDLRSRGYPQPGGPNGSAAGSSDGASEPTIDLPDNLTLREVEVLRLIAAGRSNRAIARELFVAEATVKTHINHLFAKAGIRDRAQAVRYAYRHGLVEPGGA